MIWDMIWYMILIWLDMTCTIWYIYYTSYYLVALQYIGALTSKWLQALPLFGRCRRPDGPTLTCNFHNSELQTQRGKRVWSECASWTRTQSKETNWMQRQISLTCRVCFKECVFLFLPEECNGCYPSSPQKKHGSEKFHPDCKGY